MSDFLSKAFSDEYLIKVNLDERLGVLYNVRQDALEKDNISEVLLVNLFLEIINGEVEQAEQYLNSNFLSHEDAIIKLAKGMINLTKAEKENDYQLYEATIEKLEEANLHAGVCSLFIKLLLNHAYYILGEKNRNKRKLYYSKAYEIVDSVMEENQGLKGKDREKLIRFYNDKGNILLQLADFDEDMQPLIYDENNKVKVFNNEKHKIEKVKKLNRNDCFEEAKQCFEEANRLNNKFAYAFNGLGNYYRENGKWQEAIENYKRAIELDNKFFYPLNYLGDCYRLNEMYKEAKNSFNLAIEINSNHAFSLYGLGKVHYEIGNRIEKGIESFKKSERYFKKAIKCDDSFPYAWFDLGRAKQKLESAYVPRLNLGDILKSVKSIREEECRLKDKGNSYKNKTTNINKLKNELGKKIGDYYDELIRYHSEICETFKEARARFINKFLYEKAKGEHWQKTINYCIEDVNKKIDHFNKLKEIGMKIVYGEEEPEIYEKVLFYTIATGIEEQTINNEKQFNTTFLSNKVTKVGVNDKEKHILHILRRWNSYTPIIADNSKGGGYFIECSGNGIVIDPGHNFIDNFKQGGFKFADINSILISHAHDDHTADLESIINLLFRYNKQLKENTIPRRIAKEQGIATKTIENVLKDENSPRYDEFKKLINDSYIKEKKEINLYISEGVFIKYSGIFKYDLKCQILTTEDEIKNEELRSILTEIKNYKKENHHEDEALYFVKIVHNNDKFKVGELDLHVISAHHRDLLDEGSSLGFVFEFNRTALVYTGDTGWESMREIYGNIKGELARKEIILLSHIGGFKAKEINAIDDNETIDSYYNNHLGRLGLIDVNKILEPEICIISEFGEEFKYNRVQISKIFNESFKGCEGTTRFIPGDIGLSIDLDSTLINAIVEIDSSKNEIKRQQIAVNNVEVGQYKKGNSLFYFDKTRLTENDCLQELV